MTVERLNELLDISKSLSELSIHLFGKESSTNRERCKKVLSKNGINWRLWLESKKKIPNICLYCGKEITGKYRFTKKFCNASCSASYNNRLRVKEQKQCAYCGKPLHGRSKYCDNTCYAKYKEKELTEKWLCGEERGCDISGNIKLFVKRYLLEKHSFKCQVCGYDKVNPFTNKHILQVHHIDGNCFNTSEENLMLLCPNCHALTENYGSRNDKSTRIDKRLKTFSDNVVIKDTIQKENNDVEEFSFDKMVNLMKEKKSFSAVSKEMGVSTSTICKRFVKNGYPSKLNEIIDKINSNLE